MNERSGKKRKKTQRKQERAAVAANAKGEVERCAGMSEDGGFEVMSRDYH